MLEYHEIANIFPLIEGPHFDDFRADIDISTSHFAGGFDIAAAMCMLPMAGSRQHVLLNPRGRGLVGTVRADAAQVEGLLGELKATFEQFKAAHEEELKGIKSKFDDVVSREKVDRINNLRHVGLR